MILVHILLTFCHFNSNMRELENATQIAKYPRVFIVKSLNITWHGYILILLGGFLDNRDNRPKISIFFLSLKVK